jgi:hypothetical protein
MNAASLPMVHAGVRAGDIVKEDEALPQKKAAT